MSKFVNVTVSASLSTDFYIEIPDDASEEQIKELAKKEVILPHKYPKVIDEYLRNRTGIVINGLDTMLKDWNIDELEYIIESSNDKSGISDSAEQCNA